MLETVVVHYGGPFGLFVIKMAKQPIYVIF